jgi:hypothetical protein
MPGVADWVRGESRLALKRVTQHDHPSCSAACLASERMGYLSIIIKSFRCDEIQFVSTKINDEEVTDAKPS